MKLLQLASTKLRYSVLALDVDGWRARMQPSCAIMHDYAHRACLAVAGRLQYNVLQHENMVTPGGCPDVLLYDECNCAVSAF